MNKAKLKTIVGLLIDNDLQPEIRAISAVEFAVRVSSDRGVDVALVAQVAANNGVGALVREVEYL